MLHDNDAPRPQLARPVRPRARRSNYARRETYTRVLSAMIMVGVMVTWVWIFGVVAKRRTERPVEQDEISSPAASDEPEALAVNPAPPTPQSVAASRESSDAEDAIPTAPPPAPPRPAATRAESRSAVEPTNAAGQQSTPVTDAELAVTSEPPGARVTVDGIGWGVTPLTIEHLSFGAKRVRVTMDAYVPAERTVHLAEDRPKRQLHIALRR